MKKTFLRTFVLVLVLVVAACLLVACGDEPADTTTGGNPADTTTGTTATPPVTEPYDPLVGGYTPSIGDFVLTEIGNADLADYVIVYPETASDAVRAAARELADAIKAKTGVELTVKSDYLGFGAAAPADAKEIRVGVTNRDSFTWLRKYDYRIEAVGDSVVIAATGERALDVAVDKYVELMVSATGIKTPDKAYWYQAAYAIETLKVGGFDISRFSIVRDSENAAVAEYLRARIADLTGYTLPIRTSDMPEVACEIVIGNIARGGFTFPEAGKFLIQQNGTKLMLGGSGAYAGYYATIKFMEDLTVDTSVSGATLGLTVSKTEETHRTGGLFTLNIGELGSMAGKYDVNYNVDTIMARFQAAVAELPEKITVLEPLKLEDYPFSMNNEVFVAVDGDDSNPGTEEEPLATLGAAIQKMNGRKGGVIWMKGGSYSTTGTTTLSADASGLATAPLFIKAYNDEDVTLTSLKQLDMSEGKWNYIDTEDQLHAGIIDRMDEDVVANLVYTTLDAQGWSVSDLPVIDKNGPGRLFVDDTEYSLARFPNDTGNPKDLLYFTFAADTGKVTSRDGSDLYWAWIARAATNGWDPMEERGWETYIVNSKTARKGSTTAVFFDDADKADALEAEITSWVNTGNIWYYGSCFEGWEFGFYNLALTTTEADGTKYWAHTADGRRWNPNMNETPYLGTPSTDKSKGNYTIKSTTFCSWGAKYSGNSAAGRNTYYLFNAVEALDIPGEWYYEESTGVLYLYPMDEHTEIEETVTGFSNPTTFDLLRIEGASNVVLDGINFSNSSRYGLYVKNGESVVVQNCGFKSTVSTNLTFDTCTNCAAIYSDFSQSYTTSLLNVSNSQAFRDMKAAPVVIQNNVFRDPAPYRQVGVACGGVRTVVSHNYFNNTTCNGGTSAECIVEYNLFEGGSKDITDGGMCYFGGSSARTNHFRYNLFHMFNATHNAVYNDTMGGGNYMYYNVVSTLHSTSDHNKPWYSSTGWANVSYGNITVLRTPAELRDAGSDATVESNGYANAKQGDVFNESALFYYHFGDEYSGGGAKGRYIPYDYNGNKQYPVIGSEGAYSYNTTFANTSYIDYATKEKGACLTQSLAGHWWDGIKTGDVNNYLGLSGQYDVEAWADRAPEHINMLWGTKLIIDLKEAVKAGTEDYHIKYFYIPWYLTYDADGSRKTYTWSHTSMPEDLIVEIPQYSYLEGDPNAGTVTNVVTVDAHVATPNEDGSYTLTYEEIAAMERARRAPQFSIVMNNVILGSSPKFKNISGNQYPTYESSPADCVTDGAKGLYGYVATTMVKNNFMKFDYSDMMPEAYTFYYGMEDDAWALIEDQTNPNATVEPKVIDTLKELLDGIYGESGGIDVGPTWEGFDPLDYFDSIYPNFNWDKAENDGFYWLDEIRE